MAQDARGFTLIEMMVVLAVLAVLVGVAAPAFAGLLRSAREAGAYHLLTTTLVSARMHAVTHGVPVTVCPSADGITCREDLVWEDGWIVYTDAGRHGQPQAREDVVQRLDGVGRGLALRSSPGRHRVRFTPLGWSYGSNVSIRLCDEREALLLGAVILNNAGRPRSEREDRLPCPYVP